MWFEPPGPSRERNPSGFQEATRGSAALAGSASARPSDPTLPSWFVFSSPAALPPRALDEADLLSVLEVAGCAFVGFLYIAILATAVTRKTRRNPSQPAHPDGASTTSHGDRPA